MRRILLGIDPGFTASGYAIMSVDRGRTELLECGAVKLVGRSGSEQAIEQRIGHFYALFSEKIATYHVTEIALETPFLGKNAQNFLKLGYLRGILLLLADQHACGVREFTPRQIKLAVTGFGGAEKDQVMRVVMRLFPRLPVQARLDVTDAIAVALCCLWAGAQGANSRERSS